MSSLEAPLSAVAGAASSTDVEPARNLPSRPSLIKDAGATLPRNVPTDASSDARQESGLANGTLNGVPDIDKLAFKRDPPVARGPYYSTQVEWVSIDLLELISTDHI